MAEQTDDPETRRHTLGGEGIKGAFKSNFKHEQTTCRAVFVGFSLGGQSFDWL